MRRVTVNFTEAGGLDEFKAQLIDRQEWIKQEQDQYENGPLSIGALAHRVGLDSIEVAAGLAAQGVKLKVARGTAEDREAAAELLVRNETKGCVLDLLTFWNAWRLGAVDAITKACGRIHVPQSVVDRLQARWHRLDASSEQGIRSAGYEDGRNQANMSDSCCTDVPAETATSKPLRRFGYSAWARGPSCAAGASFVVFRRAATSARRSVGFSIKHSPGPPWMLPSVPSSVIQSPVLMVWSPRWADRVLICSSVQPTRHTPFSTTRMALPEGLRPISAGIGRGAASHLSAAKLSLKWKCRRHAGAGRA